MEILVGPQGGYDGGEVGGGGGGGDDEGEVGHGRGDGGPVGTGEARLRDRGGEAAIRLHQVVGHCSTTRKKWNQKHILVFYHPSSQLLHKLTSGT